jgi:hypothetical protein
LNKENLFINRANNGQNNEWKGRGSEGAVIKKMRRLRGKQYIRAANFNSRDRDIVCNLVGQQILSVLFARGDNGQHLALPSPAFPVAFTFVPAPISLFG